VDPALPISVDVGGVKSLTLRVTDGGDGASLDNAVWGDARVTC
jgi:alpha-glucosidase